MAIEVQLCPCMDMISSLHDESWINLWWIRFSCQHVQIRRNLSSHVSNGLQCMVSILMYMHYVDFQFATCMWKTSVDLASNVLHNVVKFWFLKRERERFIMFEWVIPKLKIQAEFAKSAVDYLHRVGRTARAGQFGIVTSLYTAENRALVEAVKQAEEAGLSVVCFFLHFHFLV